jgi:hypothetical protein
LWIFHSRRVALLQDDQFRALARNLFFIFKDGMDLALVITVQWSGDRVAVW